MTYSSVSNVFDNNDRGCLMFGRRGNAMASSDDGVNAGGFRIMSSDEN